MTASVSVQQLFDALRSKLDMEWAAGSPGATRLIDCVGTENPSASLVGHLNLIHPGRIQVLGSKELDFLDGLQRNSRNDSLRQVIAARAALLVIADGRSVPEDLKTLADKSDTPVAVSSRSSDEVVSNLRYHLAHLFSEQVVLHGVFMEVMGIGVLITGDSSIGKSELALELISRGHRLIADDAPEFSRIAPDILNGSCPEILRDFLEVRGLGLLNIRAMYGDGAIRRNKYLRLLIHLQPAGNKKLREMDRLSPYRRMRRVLDVEVPEITLPVATGRNLAVLVEAAVRSHVLYLNGYDSGRDFMERQRRFVDQGQP
ncbi:MAG: hypothetical protein B7Z66_01805 [Chromatiales bacterium 21-64-14]|nr:MAG: hypothetical protein B7Z66_01805 [Chromatiales bacterium 21-64-14]HQU14949.1 HPr(Ser) kinase/phosphatase [Gammaproteobacteria bacterium]